MIASEGILRKVCRNYHLVENYMQARFDKENKWDLHHRREIDEMKSRQQLIDEGRYYDVEPQELIFLTHSEHLRLHMINVLPETRKKNSEANRGKKRSAETRNKISERAKERTGEKNPLFGICGEKNKKFGTHWWNNGIISRQSKECPGEGFVKGRTRK